MDKTREGERGVSARLTLTACRIGQEGWGLRQASLRGRCAASGLGCLGFVAQRLVLVGLRLIRPCCAVVPVHGGCLTGRLRWRAVAAV